MEEEGIASRIQWNSNAVSIKTSLNNRHIKFIIMWLINPYNSNNTEKD